MHGYLFTRPMEVWCRCSSDNWVESMPLNNDFYVVRVHEAGQKAYSRKVLIRTVGK